jgi:hypothetical protein
MTVRSGESAGGLTWKPFELRDFSEVRCKHKRKPEARSFEVPKVDLHHRSGEKRLIVGSSQGWKLQCGMKDRELPKIQSLKLIQTIHQEGHVSTNWIVQDFSVRKN